MVVFLSPFVEQKAELVYTRVFIAFNFTFSSWVLCSNKQWLHVVDEKIGLCIEPEKAVCRTSRGNWEKCLCLQYYTYLFAQSSLFPLWQASAFQCVIYKASCDQLSFQPRVSWLGKHTGSNLEFFSITYLSNNERSDCSIPGSMLIPWVLRAETCWWWGLGRFCSAHSV